MFLETCVIEILLVIFVYFWRLLYYSQHIFCWNFRL